MELDDPPFEHGQGAHRNGHLRGSVLLRSVRKEFAKQGRKTMQEALDAYEEYLSTDKQNKAVSVANTMYRLEAFFSDKDMMLGDSHAESLRGLLRGAAEAEHPDEEGVLGGQPPDHSCSGEDVPAVVLCEAAEVGVAKSGGGSAGRREEEARKASAPDR